METHSEARAYRARRLCFLVSITSRVDIALAELPPVMTPKELGGVLGKSTDALAQERWLRKGIPFIKYGSRVYYLRSDVAAFLAANRHGGEQAIAACSRSHER
jgi:hypothetical protein